MNEWIWTIVIVLVVLLLFGAKRIPDVMKSLGQGIKEFKKAAKEIQSDTPDPEPHRRQEPTVAANTAQKPTDPHMN
jgi:sec-independent protein translocase protein TatA